MSRTTAPEYGDVRDEVQDESVEYFHSSSGFELKAYTCDPIQCSLPQMQ